MAAMALSSSDPMGGSGGPRRRKQSPVTFGRVLVVVGAGLVLVLAYTLIGRQTVSERPNEMKTTTVILPPPPPPPPPEVKPQETPPEPKPMPLEQPVTDTPPPTPDAQPTVGDNALTAREGAGPSNYGLAMGDGGGTRIGGRPGGAGGDGFAAYANVALAGIRQAAQGDRDLSRGRFTVQLAVTIGSDGRITNVRVISGGDEKRNARLRDLLTGLQLSQRPPAGLPVMRIELNARSGA